MDVTQLQGQIREAVIEAVTPIVEDNMDVAVIEAAEHIRNVLVDDVVYSSLENVQRDVESEVGGALEACGVSKEMTKEIVDSVIVSMEAHFIDRLKEELGW